LTQNQNPGPTQNQNPVASGVSRTSAYAEIYSETDYPAVAGWSPLQALTDGRWMTIRAGSTTEVYDLMADSDEKRDLVSAQAGVARGMSARIDAIRSAHPTASPRSAVSEEAAERLRALGYVASVRPTPASGAPNPASAIAAWNAFEEALGALNAKQADAVGRLQRLASANPAAPIFASTYARALKDAGQTGRALAEYPAGARPGPTPGPPPAPLGG